MSVHVFFDSLYYFFFSTYNFDFAWSFAGFIIYIFFLPHNNIKHHHQHETYGEADGAEIAVLAA